jgi:hypothetical protein
VNEVTVAAVTGALSVPPPQAVRMPDRMRARSREERRDGEAGMRKR